MIKQEPLEKKRKSAAVSTVLGQAIKPTKDTRTDIEKKLIAAGFIPGTDEYQAAKGIFIVKRYSTKKKGLNFNCRRSKRKIYQLMKREKKLIK